MPRLLTLIALAATLAVSACAPMSQDAYLVPAGPNPPPPPGYKVECTAQPVLPTFFLWPTFRTGCQQVIDPQADVVISARG